VGLKELEEEALLRVTDWLRDRRLIHLRGAVFRWIASISYFTPRSYPLGPPSRSEHSGIIGSLAHFAEYAGLATLLYRALSGG